MTEITLTPFNAQNWPINVQVAFEDWATIPCIRIITYLYSRKGKPAYSVRGIGIMLGVGKTQLAEAIKLLIKHNYITKIGGCYFLNSSISEDELSGKPDSCPENDSLVSGKPDKTVRKTGHNNSKEIILNNNTPLPQQNPKKEAPENNSPTAPKNLKRKKDPLLEVVENVWITEEEQIRLIQKFGSSEEARFQAEALSSYSKTNPSAFRKYVDHYLTIQTFRRRSTSKAAQFFKHPDTGWNYYPNYEKARLQKEGKL